MCDFILAVLKFVLDKVTNMDDKMTNMDIKMNLLAHGGSPSVNQSYAATYHQHEDLAGRTSLKRPEKPYGYKIGLKIWKDMLKNFTVCNLSFFFVLDCSHCH